MPARPSRSACRNARRASSALPPGAGPYGVSMCLLCRLRLVTETQGVGDGLRLLFREADQFPAAQADQGATVLDQGAKRCRGRHAPGLGRALCPARLAWRGLLRRLRLFARRLALALPRTEQRLSPFARLLQQA